MPKKQKKGMCQFCNTGIAVVACMIRNAFLCESCAREECLPFIDHANCDIY